jgi:hypothetical protein
MLEAEQNLGIVMRLEGSGTKTNKQTPWPLVRERTIPTERPLNYIHVLHVESNPATFRFVTLRLNHQY